MYFVYYLGSQKSEKFHYIGCTSDLHERLSRHNSMRVRATKRHAPLILLGYRAFNSRHEAFSFEKAVKKNYKLRLEFINNLTSNAG